MIPIMIFCSLLAGEPHTHAQKSWSGEGYHHYSRVQYIWAKEFLSECPLMGNEKILDIGCGDGKITAEIAAKVPDGEVWGIDRSLSMIEFAKQTFLSESVNNLYFDLQDALLLPYQSQFDIVFSFCCLHWVEDQLTALRGIHRSLRANGSFCAIVPYPLTFDLAIGAVLDQNPWNNFHGTLQPIGWFRFDENRYVELLRQANFSPRLIEMKDVLTVYDDKMQLMQWLKLLLPLDPLSPQEQEAFIWDVIDTVLLQHPQALQPSGAIHIPQAILLVKAQKE